MLRCSTLLLSFVIILGALRSEAQDRLPFPEAAKALAEWKAILADEVVKQANVLASSSNPPGLITIDHFRLAVTPAMRTLEMLLQEKDSNDDRREAA